MSIESHSCDDFLKVLFLGSSDVSFGFDLSGGKDFNLFSTSGFLNLSLELFLSLSLWISLGKNAQLSQSEVGFVLDEVLLVIVCQTESSWSVTTKSGSESVKDDVFGVPSVLGWDQSSKISLRYIWFAFVVNVQK